MKKKKNPLKKREKKSKRKKRGRTRSKMVGTIWIGKDRKTNSEQVLTCEHTVSGDWREKEK